MNDHRNPWTTLSHREIYKNPWIRVLEHQVLDAKKNPSIYGVIELQNKAIGILAVTNQDEIYLVGQWRYPLGFYSWEIIEGGAPLGTDWLASAKRELKEEAGLTAKNWRQVMQLHTSNSVTNEHAIIFLAEDLVEGEAEPEDDEVLEIKKVPLKEAYKMVERGEITDAMSVAGIQHLYIERSISR